MDFWLGIAIGGFLGFINGFIVAILISIGEEDLNEDYKKGFRHKHR